MGGVGLECTGTLTEFTGFVLVAGVVAVACLATRPFSAGSVDKAAGMRMAGGGAFSAGVVRMVA